MRLKNFTKFFETKQGKKREEVNPCSMNNVGAVLWVDTGCRVWLYLIRRSASRARWGGAKTRGGHVAGVAPRRAGLHCSSPPPSGRRPPGHHWTLTRRRPPRKCRHRHRSLPLPLATADREALALAACVPSLELWPVTWHGKEHRLGWIGGVVGGGPGSDRADGHRGWLDARTEIEGMRMGFRSIQREQRVCCATCSGMPSPDLLDATVLHWLDAAAVRRGLDSSDELSNLPTSTFSFSLYVLLLYYRL